VPYPYRCSGTDIDTVKLTVVVSVVVMFAVPVFSSVSLLLPTSRNRRALQETFWKADDDPRSFTVIVIVHGLVFEGRIIP